jgi:hypothetical protein
MAQTATKENPIEMYFTWYLDELVSNGFLKSYEREPETMIVLDSHSFKRERHLKTKENPLEDITLLPAITYTYDYRLVWHSSALNIFTEVYKPDGHFRFGIPTFISHYIEINGMPEIVSYVDVKPHYSAASFGGGKMASFYTFPFIQKFLMDSKGLYINKAIPVNQGKHGINTCLFAQTFTPNRYEFTDAGQQLRKIKFKKTSITSYVSKQRAIINRLLDDIAKKNLKNNQQTLL